MRDLKQNLAVGGFMLSLLSCGTESRQEVPQPRDNRDVPQHFTVNLNLRFQRTTEGVLYGQMIGRLEYDETLQQLAQETIDSGQFADNPQEVELLEKITTGSTEVGLADFTIELGSEHTVTDHDGTFQLAITGEDSFITVKYDEVDGTTSTLATFDIPQEPGMMEMFVPLQFDHQHSQSRPLHDHSIDQGEYQQVEQGLNYTRDLSCRKCNGWWDRDGGRAGSDCFRALSQRFAPCWAEMMKIPSILGGRFCNGTRNCSIQIGHGWNDTHTHGSSVWYCR
ncbi:MAG: hypothetical protein WC862_00395 [Patescibacteria group bacterium]